MAGELVEVELDDDAAAAAPRVRARRVLRARWSARAWARVAAALALVLGVGAGLDGAFASSLARVPDGLVADLRLARTPRWSAPAGDVLGVVGDTLVVGSPDGEQVQALSLADGRPRWSLDASGCSLTDTSRYDVQATSAIAPGDARLLCRFMRNTQTTTVVIADAADGEVLTRFTDGPGDSWVSAVGGFALSTTTLATGDTHVSVSSLVTGEHLWQARVDEAAQAGWYVQDGTWVLMTDPPRARDLTTGTEVAAPSVVEWRSQPFPDGSVVRLTAAAVSSEAEAWTTVLDPDGTERWRVPGAASVGPALSGDVVPVRQASGGLEARDLRSGEVLWETDRSLMPFALAGGVLVAFDWQPEVAGSAVTTGLDARTGEELWRGADLPDRLVTDGTRFATVEPGGVAVHDLRTGSVVRRWAMGAGDVPGEGDMVETGSLVPLPGGELAWAGDGQVLLLGL